MADYTAGNLNLEIMGVNDSAVKSISAVVKSLNSLSRALSKINATQTVLAGNQLTLLFEKMGKAASSMDASKIANFASAAKSLNSISRIGSLEKVDWGKVAAGFNNLTVAITPFVNKVKEAESSLTALYGILSKSSGKKIQGLLDGGGASSPKAKKSGFSFLNVAKWGAVIYSARRLGRLVGEVAQAGADYTETLNLWETAMGNNLSVATEFVKKMNEAYGVSEKTLMNAQAIFKNMLGSLGQISDQMAYALSEGVTQMALDYASLYNQTFEQAFTKFQAALAGQVRPIRSVAGYDITENTLFQLYQSLGGEKTMRQLSRTEKQLLSILAIFNQMSASGAVGDLNKTMESFANQSRVMAEAWQEVVSYSGVLLSYAIQQSGILTYINATLIFIGTILKGVAEEIDAIQHFGDPFGTTTESALEATNAVDELNGRLLDFDKIRALNESQDTSLNIDTNLIEALKNYNSILNNADMEAKKIAKRWLKIFGIIDDSGNIIIDIGDIIPTIIGNIDFEEASLNFSEFLHNSSIKLNTFLHNLPWGEIGKDIAEIISNTDWSQMVQDGLISLEEIAYGLVILIEGAFDEIDWDKLWGEAVDIGEILLSGLWSNVLSHQQLMGDLRKTFIDPFLIALADGAYHVFAALWNAIMGIFEGIVNIIPDIINAVIDALNYIPNVDIPRMERIKNPFYIPDRLNIQGFALGGLPDRGSLFVAGEAGAEMVYNMPSGQSGVANIQQIKSAFYQALVEYGRTQNGDDRPIEVYLDGEKVYESTTAHAKRRGNVWSKS